MGSGIRWFTKPLKYSNPFLIRKYKKHQETLALLISEKPLRFWIVSKMTLSKYQQYFMKETTRRLSTKQSIFTIIKNTILIKRGPRSLFVWCLLSITSSLPKTGRCIWIHYKIKTTRISKWLWPMTNPPITRRLRFLNLLRRDILD